MPDRAFSLRDGALLAGLTAAGLWAAMAWLPPLAAADRWVEDLAVARLAPPQPQHPAIAIIAITEDSLAALPYRAPLDRGLLADLIARLRGKGVRAIGLDVLLDQPTEPAKDAALHAALTAAGAPVVALSAAAATPLTQRQRRFHDGFLAGLAQGHGNLAKDRLDGVVRRHRPWLDGRPSLPAALAAIAGGITPPREDFTIAWRRPADPGLRPFVVYPAEAVAMLPAAWLAGRIVLVGTTVPDSDRHRTPLSATMGTSPGVEIQAQVLAQLLDGRAAPNIGGTARGAVVALPAAAGVALAAIGLPPLLLALAAVGGAVLMWLAAAVTVMLGGPLLSPLAPSLAWLTAIGAASALASVRERQARTTLMGLFAAHLSGPVAEEIWLNRRTLLSGGRPRPHSLMATVLFTDIENFTPASERLGPERLMAWLETYMEAMTDIVTGHGGIVLRFIGDGILAAFGAPLPRSDEAAVTADAVQAVCAALAMEDALRRLNRDWSAAGLPEIRIRAGIVTGPMVGGSIGARRHLEYTLMGDAVNTAARLEALAKTVAAAPGHPCRILAARSTWERVADRVRAVPVGEVALKGKENRVAVYRILGLAEEASGRDAAG